MVLEVGPCVVTQVKTEDKDGYAAVQVGFGDRKEKPTSRPWRDTSRRPACTRVKSLEFSVASSRIKLGDEVKLERRLP